MFPWVDVRVVVGGFSRSCAAVGGRSRVGGWVLAFLRVGARGVHESVGGFSRSFGLTFAGRWVDFRVPAFLRVGGKGRSRVGGRIFAFLWVDVRGSMGGFSRSCVPASGYSRVDGWNLAFKRVEVRRSESG